MHIPPNVHSSSGLYNHTTGAIEAPQNRWQLASDLRLRQLDYIEDNIPMRIDDNITLMDLSEDGNDLSDGNLTLLDTTTTTNSEAHFNFGIDVSNLSETTSDENGSFMDLDASAFQHGDITQTDWDSNGNISDLLNATYDDLNTTHTIAATQNISEQSISDPDVEIVFDMWTKAGREAARHLYDFSCKTEIHM